MLQRQLLMDFARNDEAFEHFQIPHERPRIDKSDRSGPRIPGISTPGLLHEVRNTMLFEEPPGHHTGRHRGECKAQIGAHRHVGRELPSRPMGAISEQAELLHGGMVDVLVPNRNKGILICSEKLPGLPIGLERFEVMRSISRSGTEENCSSSFEFTTPWPPPSVRELIVEHQYAHGVTIEDVLIRSPERCRSASGGPVRKFARYTRLFR